MAWVLSVWANDTSVFWTGNVKLAFHYLLMHFFSQNVVFPYKFYPKKCFFLELYKQWGGGEKKSVENGGGGEGGDENDQSRMDKSAERSAAEGTKSRGVEGFGRQNSCRFLKRMNHIHLSNGNARKSNSGFETKIGKFEIFPNFGQGDFDWNNKKNTKM